MSSAGWHVVARLALLSVALCTSSQSVSAPAPKLLPAMEKHNPNSKTAVSHQRWSDFLAEHLTFKDGASLLDYASALNQLGLLRDYIDDLAQTPVYSLNRNEQLVFWINLYNALTVKVVLEHYPVSSIKKISSGFFATGLWREKRIVVAGKKLSLNDIEHRILRPIWKDPRIHYAVNCAAIGCPNLAMHAFSANQVNNMLDSAASDYINHARGVTITDGKLAVSSIYRWYADDFGGRDEAVIAHLKKYAKPLLRDQLAGFTEISGHFYDWSLNDSHP